MNRAGHGEHAVSPRSATHTPEQSLVVRCAKSRPDENAQSRIRAIAAEHLDWHRVIRLAKDHGVLPLLARNLHTLARDSVPREILDDLRQLFLANSARNLFLTNELTRILAAFSSHGISAMPLKGPVLASFAYGDPSLRVYNDLDILVKQQDVTRAKDLLRDHRYLPAFSLTRGQEEALLGYQHHYSLLSADHSALVELHWSLKAGRRWVAFSNGPVWQRSQMIAVEGTAARCLGAEDLMLYLCVHGSEHCWTRLAWVSDVAELIRCCPGICWDEVIETATELRARRAVLLGVALAKELLATELPGALRELVDRDTRVLTLVQWTLRRIFSVQDQGLGLAEMMRYRLTTCESVCEKLRFIWHRAAVPDPLDLQMAVLPPRLSGLYFLVRPMRLFGKYVLGRQRGPK